MSVHKGGSHVTITNDVLELTVQPPNLTLPSDLGPHLALAPFCYLYLVAVTGDLFKLVHVRIPSPHLPHSTKLWT